MEPASSNPANGSDPAKSDLAKLLGPLGAEVMRVVWAATGPVTVRAVLQRLNAHRVEPLAYTTVMTVMTRLADREALRRSQVGRSYEYVPAVVDVAELAVRSVVRDYGEAAVTHFVDHARADPRLLHRLEQQMRQAEGAGG